MNGYPNTQVTTDDDRIKYLCREHPEITYKAAVIVASLLAEAEDKGRAYAAAQLTDEFEAAKEAGRKEERKTKEMVTWAADRLVDAGYQLVRARQDYLDAIGKAGQKP